MKNQKRTVHLIGIGGIGMSGLARMYLAMGDAVQGTDVKMSGLLSQLETEGAKVVIGHEGSHVNGADLVVYSSSIGTDHPERAEALKKGVRVIHRAQALSEMCAGKFTIAVTGTHGKTTTTALIGALLKEAGRDPSIVVGGVVEAFGGNACHGRGAEIVIEADESDASFLLFEPKVEVITNVEKEHMDHYRTVENMESAYREFIRRLPENGEWLGCSEDPVVRRIAGEKIRPCAFYGFDPGQNRYAATDLKPSPEGKRGISFVAWAECRRLGPVELGLLGSHNVLNALAALGMGLKLGISFDVICRALRNFTGTARRFDVKYEDKDFLIVDDYAHHPTEIRRTLEAARSLPLKRIVALFQPHRYTRTQALLEDFGTSFSSADKLIVTDIYAASENPLPGISGERLSEVIRRTGHPDVTFVDRSKAEAYVRSVMRPGDLVIALGAGDICQVADQIAQSLKRGLAGPFSAVRGKVLLNEPLSRHTTLRVGGPAKFWVEPCDEPDLKKVLAICKKNSLKFCVFGAGSNLLAPDAGYHGAVIHLAGASFKGLRVEGERVLAGAGVPNPMLIQFALENGFGGFEFLVGIPGCVGGSLAMNAGSHGQSMQTYVDTVRIVDFEGRTAVLRKKEIPFRYRSSGLKGAVITEASFLFPPRTRPEVQKKLDEYREYRQRTQDLQHASAGCMFKNPDSFQCSSGKLIEDTGLKGRTLGRAQVSEKHANFIINLGGATAGDICRLIEEVQQAVHRKFGVSLETEVRILNDD
ncbi:MAG: UDP-N-acetylmuramate--L-alanine ligase [Candidatus Omnitrophica bacterium]|nr:UDP-N-acetylmuramate--L-alanine ligase [Candidatus Omnitrophota bacterium]